MNAPVIHPATADTVPSSEGTTPVMAQFLAAKASQPDAIVFFRMGDFYELFFKDAEIASKALGITLTRRGKHQGQDIPMAGVPVHALDGYLARLIRQGFKAAICEQLEAPSEARKRGSKAVVHRDIVRVVTPGTLTEDSLLRHAEPTVWPPSRCARAGPPSLWWNCRPDRSMRSPVRSKTLARPWPRSGRRKCWCPTGCSRTRRRRPRSTDPAASFRPCRRPWPSRSGPAQGSSGFTASPHWTASAPSRRPRSRRWALSRPIWRRPRPERSRPCRRRAGRATAASWRSTRRPG